MTQLPPADRARFPAEGPPSWLWYAGALRIVVLIIIAVGACALPAGADPLLMPFLAAFYAFGFLCSVGYLVLLYTAWQPTPLLTWAQMLVDFGVVAATVNSTGGASSLFTFLFVVVILETGLLLGIAQGFVFATFAAGFMAIELLQPADKTPLNIGYTFLIQSLAYYLTAAISGYWNLRVNRMQQFQRDILDNMNSGFMIVNAEGVITVQNKAADRILRLREGEAVGRRAEEVLRDAEGGECPVVTALRTQRDFTRYEFDAQVGSDTAKTLGLSTSCLSDGKGRLTGVIVSFTDLTELARMRKELQRQDRLAAVGELAAGLAHEIRNPVAAIRGAVDELHGNLGSRELADRLADIAVRECDHLNHIISEFLNFAREPQIERTPFHVCELIQEVCALLQREFAHLPDIKIIVTPCADGCIVSGDWTQLKQVFYNIGKNAIEAMKTRGRLTIAVNRDPVSVAVRFDDEGPGIPPDEVARIFEPFYTSKGSGVGIGLAVCLRIVTAHDGAIYVASRPGGGASITVRLPAARTEE